MVQFSVIVPNYNHERFLKERIESILNQTYPHFELILLDDASTDNSRNIIESYRNHPRVSRIVYNEKNSGHPMHQWKKGIELARHEWVWIAESDDSCEPDFLEHCAHAIGSNSGLVVVASESTWTDEQGRKLGSTAYGRDIPQPMKGREALETFMLHENILQNASAIVFKKDAINESELLPFRDYKWCGDWAFWNHLLAKGDLFYLKKPFNYFRRHAHVLSKQYYDRGYLYKEGLAVSLHFQKKLNSSFITRFKIYRIWSDHLTGQYFRNFREGNNRLYLFKPLYYCMAMHLAIPFIVIYKTARNIIKKFT